jgi:hypothetical protein
MKKIMIFFAMVLALQVLTAQTVPDGSSHQETEMRQKSSCQTANDTFLIDQLKSDQLINQYSEMSYGGNSSQSGQSRGLLALLKLILIGFAFASRGNGNSSGND